MGTRVNQRDAKWIRDQIKHARAALRSIPKRLRRALSI